MRKWAALLLLFGTGCPGTTDDTGDDTVAVDPYWFWVVGNFGYDPDAPAGERYVAYTIDGQTRNPGLSITLASEEYARDYDPSLACSIVVEHPGPLAAAEWIGDADIDLGVQIPSGASATVTTNCDFSELDPDLWGEDPQGRLLANAWGIGVGPLDAELAAPLIAEVNASDDEDWATDYEPYVSGGGFHSSAMTTLANPGGYSNSAMTRAYVVDEGMAAVTDQDGGYQQHLASDVTDGVPPKGIYVTTTLSFLTGAADLFAATASDTGDTGDTGN